MYIDMYGLMWLSIGFFVFGGCFYYLFIEDIKDTNDKSNSKSHSV